MPAPRHPLAAVLSIAALTLLAAPVDASARPGGYGGYGAGVHGASTHHAGYRSRYYGGYGHGYYPGGVSIGIGLGFGGFYLGSPWYPGPWYYPGYTLAVPA